MNPIVIIPARMASTRLPGKPLADIAGVPMILRVWRNALASAIGPVVVAAAEPEIARAVNDAGGLAVLTDPALSSGTDRVFAALQAADVRREHNAVVNLQGDLPLFPPQYLRDVVESLAASRADIATLAAPIEDEKDFDNPNVVKPVISWMEDRPYGRALYFTRARAPFGDGVLYHHVGIYAFRRTALERFVGLPRSPLEARENLEQLRALEAGMSIAVARVDEAPLSVDTPADLARARAAAMRHQG
jgi:3-deoxy-manno-octulosonate cytidylyltransferase (CMP-KDO synthetase)